MFEVYSNTKIAETDYRALWEITDRYENSVTMITCEDEMSEGGYENRRIVAARPIG